MAKANSRTRLNFGYGAIYQRKTKDGRVRWYLDFKDATGKDVKKGDTVELSLANGEGPLLTNSETLTEDKETYLLQAGKRAVPAGGWPQEWKFSATVKITRDGKTLIEQSSGPVPFE